MVETTTRVDTSDWNNESDSPEAIRARIKETRAHMSEVVDEIQAKLSPERLTQEAKDLVKDATVRKVEKMANITMNKADTWRSQVVETVKHNPIPAALIGIGLGWLLIESSRSSSDYDYEPNYGQPYYGTSTGRVRHYPQERSFASRAQESLSENVSNVQHRASEMTHNVQDKVGEVAGNVQHRAGEVVDNLQHKADELQHRAGEMVNNLQHKAGEWQGTVSEQANYLADQTQYQMRRARQTFQSTLETNPLAVSAVALAAGAAVGLMLPITQKEDEIMGETRDRLFHQAQDKAKETLKKVEHKAEEAYQKVSEELKSETKQSNTEAKQSNTEGQSF